MSAIKQFANWLGLGPDEADPYAEHVPPMRDRYETPRYETPSPPPPYPTTGRVSELPEEPAPAAPEPAYPFELAQTDTAFPVRSASGLPEKTLGNLRPIKSSDTAKPVVVNPNSYEDAQQIGVQFKSRQPVIVNLEDAEVDLRRRLIDFVSGLCFALDGKVKRVTHGVYLLTPSDTKVEMSDTPFPGHGNNNPSSPERP